MGCLSRVVSQFSQLAMSAIRFCALASSSFASGIATSDIIGSLDDYMVPLCSIYTLW